MYNWNNENNNNCLFIYLFILGIFGYPLYSATHVALRTIRTWLETDDNYKKVKERQRQRQRQREIERKKERKRDRQTETVTETEKQRERKKRDFMFISLFIFLKKKVDKIVFCTFLEKELECYQLLMPLYFPPPGKSTDDVVASKQTNMNKHKNKHKQTNNK